MTRDTAWRVRSGRRRRLVGAPTAMRLLGAVLFVLLLVGRTAATLAFAQGTEVRVTLSPNARAAGPGDLVIATVRAPEDDGPPRVSAFDRELPVAGVAPGVWKALVPIDIEQKPGVFELRVDRAGRPVQPPIVARFTVVPRQFETRRLRVPPAFVAPSPEVAERMARERALLDAIYGQIGGTADWAGGFLRPVSEVANSRFGARTVFNGALVSRHLGADFLSPAGTPIGAPCAGRVALARELYLTGNTVVIDHGLGVFSVLAHLSELGVEEGARVSTGQLVGRVGATGRVTGPHLHWGLRIGPARIDPLAALEEGSGGGGLAVRTK